MTRQNIILFVIIALISLPIFACAQEKQLPVIASASKLKIDRLKILNDELKDTGERLANALANDPKNSEKLDRIRADMVTLGREIERVKKDEVVQNHWQEKQSKQSDVKVAESVEKTDEKPRSFESWDVFNNFGKKGN